MTTVVVEHTVGADEVAAFLTPRAYPVREEAVEGDPHRFTMAGGPLDRYERVVEVHEDDDGTTTVTATIDFVLAIPIWGFLFRGLYKSALEDPFPPDRTPWWAPPDEIDARGARSLSLLCVYAAFSAYMGTLLSQTNTYFGKEFGASKSELADVLIGVRLGAFLGLLVMLVADRVGRRRVLVGSLVAGCCVTALGAAAPNLLFLGLTQSAGRAFSATMAVLAVIMAAEEMPANSRAFSVSMLTMSGALGAGGVVLGLQFAEGSTSAWRAFFVVPLLFLVPGLRLARSLPETRRFEVHEELGASAMSLGLAGGGAGASPAAPGPSTAAAPKPDVPRGSHLRRFLILGIGGLLFNIFLAPAANFLNDYLKEQHSYQGWQISLMQVITNVPGGASIIIGGRLADRYGRKIIGAIGAGAGVGFSVLMFTSSGWGIWVFSFFGTLVGAIAVPALGVYGPELFPTKMRGRAGGGLNILAVMGSVIGLKFVGVFAGDDHFGSYSEPMAILGIAGLLLVFVILVFYPETANRELEDLNPEDRPPPTDPDDLAELDHDFAEHHHLPPP